MPVFSALTSLTEHQLLIFWTQLAALVVVALLLGALARRFGQPSVVGELTAGLLLGPSVMGKLAPGGFDWLFPADDAQSAALLAVGWLGVSLLLLTTGFETDLALIARLGRAAVLVAAASLIVPFALGLGLGYALPESFIGPLDQRLPFALFIAAALSISSLPVIAKILSELGMLRRNFGQITLAAGMANDVVGWIVLGIIAGIASTGGADLGKLSLTIVGLFGFLAFAITIGQRIVDFLLRSVRREDDNLRGALAVTLGVTLVAAVITQALHVEAVLGAFVAGIVLGRSRYLHPHVPEHIEALVTSLLAPIFFATAGLRVDLAALADATVLMWASAMIFVASVGKFGGAYIGAIAAGLDHREGLALGAGLNARGALEIVVATIGLSLGVLDDSSYTVVVVLAIVTSVLAPPSLRLAVRGWHGSEEERERLDREKALSGNVVVRTTRILMPTRGGPGSIAAAQVLHFAWPEEAQVTTLTAGVTRPDLTPMENVFHGRTFEHHQAESESLVEAVEAQLKLGFGVVGLATSSSRGDHTLLGEAVDELLRVVTVPIVIVRPAPTLESRLPGAFSRALVPVSGDRSSRAAQEIAFSISRALGTRIVLAHAVERSMSIAGTARPGNEGRLMVAEQLLADADAFGRELGVEPSAAVLQVRVNPATALLRHAMAVDADLLVMGATIRRLEGRPYLGATAEQVLHDSPATVVIVAIPE